MGKRRGAVLCYFRVIEKPRERKKEETTGV
jgi:hypothetical protein